MIESLLTAKEDLTMKRKTEEKDTSLNGLYLAILIAVVFMLLNVIATVNGMSPFAAF